MKTHATASLDLDAVLGWCEERDGRPTEGWLLALLDGTIALDEFRAAVSEGRAPREVVASGPEKAFSDLFDAMVAEDLTVTVGTDPRPWRIEPFGWRTQGACTWLSPGGFVRASVTPYWEGAPSVAVEIGLGVDAGDVEAYSIELPAEPITRESYLALLQAVLLQANEHARKASDPVYSVWVASADPDALPRDRADVQILNVSSDGRSCPEVELLGTREALIAFLREHWSGIDGGDEQWFIARVESFELRPGMQVTPVEARQAVEVFS